MSYGKNIRILRRRRHLTRDQVADKLGVSFGAVSSWEWDRCDPDTKNLINLALILGVPVSTIVEEKKDADGNKEDVCDCKQMESFVKASAESMGLSDTLNAVDLAVKTQEGHKGNESDGAYTCHPLNNACHALALNIKDDTVIAGCLLNDVMEDVNEDPDELPVSDEVRAVVLRLNHVKAIGDTRETVKNAYYKSVSKDPRAALIKCIDRYNSIASMAADGESACMTRTIMETERYYPALIDVLKVCPEYNHAAMILEYQFQSILGMYKQVM